MVYIIALRSDNFKSWLIRRLSGPQPRGNRFIRSSLILTPRPPMQVSTRIIGFRIVGGVLNGCPDIIQRLLKAAPHHKGLTTPKQTFRITWLHPQGVIQIQFGGMKIAGLGIQPGTGTYQIRIRPRPANHKIQIRARGITEAAVEPARAAGGRQFQCIFVIHQRFRHIPH